MGVVAAKRAAAKSRRQQAGTGSAAWPAERLEPRMLLAFAPLGPEFRVNTFTAGRQFVPSLATDADGDFVVAWASDGQDGSGLGVYAQRYSATGVALGGEFRVNTFTAGHQYLPSVATDADGDFVVAWQSDGQDGSGVGVYAQRFSAAGAPLGGEFRVNTYTASDQASPAVAMDADGDFVVAWASVGQDGSGFGVYAQRYSAAGAAAGGEFRVNTFTAGNEFNPSVAMDASGDFVVAWNDGQDGSGLGIRAQRYSAAGTALGTEFRVNSFTADSQGVPSVASDADGDFVVVWQSRGQDGADYGVYAQRYSAAGAALGTEFRVNTFTASRQWAPSVAADADGDFVVAWESNVQDGSGYGIYAQRYSAAGAPMGAEFPVNTVTSSFQRNPSVASDADGDLVVAWQSDGQDGPGYGVYAQRYAETSDAAGPVASGVAVRGAPLRPGGQVTAGVGEIVVSFSERLSTLGGAAGPNSVTNPGNWALVRGGGDDLSSSIRSVEFRFNDATRKYEAVLELSPALTAGSYELFALPSITDVAANALDGDMNGTSGGMFAFPFEVVNDAPTTIGIPPVTVAEDETDAVVNLFDAFSDPTDPDAALVYEVVGNSNPGLFTATRPDRAAGTLTLDFAPNANGEAQLTVRATDTGGSSVETTFTVTVLAVNDAPVNSVPGTQVVRPGQVITFSKDLGNAVTVSDVDDTRATVAVTIERPANLAIEVPGGRGVVVEELREAVRITGAIADVNAALDGLLVSQVERREERVSLAITTDDLGSRGIGGPMIDTDVVPLVFENAPVLLTVGDATVSEGNAGTVNATFAVRLSGRPAGVVRVRYATADGTATVSGDDYQPAQGELVFEVGETEKTVSVPVNGDFDVEGDERFFLNLSAATGALIGDGQGIGTVTNDDAPLPPPVVTQVFVSGSGWTPAYKNFLAARGLGDATFGYAVPAGAGQLAVLPWGNLNQVSVRFNTDVLVLDVDLVVRGVRSTAYAFNGFEYDDATHTATWTLVQPVVNDKLILDVNGGEDGVVNPQAVLLDGDWANGADAFPSGDGTPGGNLRFRLNVLGGDVTRNGRVDYSDWLELRRRGLHTAANPGTGPTGYTAFHDPSGDGVIGTMDLLMVRRNLLRGLPATEPAGGAVLAAAAPSITKDLFGGAPILG